MAKNVATVLRDLRRGRLGWSMEKMATELGYAGQSSYQRYETELEMEGKRLPFHLFYKLVMTIEGKGEPPIRREELLPLADDVRFIKGILAAEHIPGQENLPGIPIRGVVAAGVWREADYAMDTSGWAPIPGSPDRRFAGMRQFAVLIEGNSVNKSIRDSEFAICVNFADVMRDVREGDLAVVQRTRDGGLHEYTIKRVVGTREGGFELWPESTDPQFQAPLSLAESPDNTEVTVIGLVIGRYAPL